MIRTTLVSIAALFVVASFAVPSSTTASAHVLKMHGSEAHYARHSARHARKHARKAARRARRAARRATRRAYVHPRYKDVVVNEETMEWTAE